jgi:DnaJ-class molecular chaperone
MSEWQKCPVCEGSGQVPYGFYDSTGYDGGATYFPNEICRTCQGKGIILKPLESPEVVVTYFTVPTNTG